MVNEVNPKYNIGSIARKGLNYLPGSLEFLWSTKNFINNCWAWPSWKRIYGNRLPDALMEWRADLETVPRLTQLPHKRILFFTGGMNIIEHSLATSFVLCHRNCDVDLVWLSGMRLVGPEDTYNQRKFSYYYNRALRMGSTISKGHRLIPLDTIQQSEIDSNMEEAAREQALIDTVYLTLQETIDIEGRDQSVYQHRVNRNKEAIARLLTLIRQQKYDVLVTQNGAVREFGAIFRLAQLVGLPTGTYEFWYGPETAVISYGPCVMQIPTDFLWQEDAPHLLSTERRQKALEILETRKTTQKSGIVRERLVQMLSLKSGVPNVLICPNVPFDGLFVGKDLLFPSMHEWLIKVIHHLEHNGLEANIIIRSHPDEKKYLGSETTESIIRSSVGLLPNSFHLIPATSKISTYDLMEISQLGIVYSSTTGLEMAAMGVPVVNGNFFHYSGKGFTHDPTTPEEYFQIIDRILSAPWKYQLTQDQVDMALSYLDIYFNKLPVPFPWGFKNFWGDMNKWPVRRVMSQEGEQRFGLTLDRLVGRQ